MTTPASQTLNYSLADATDYGNGESKVIQGPLDDALITAKANAIADGVDKMVIIQITPPNATQPGFSGGIKWTQEETREYLFPPGDSSKYQPSIASAVLASCNQATATGKITQATITVHPT